MGGQRSGERDFERKLRDLPVLPIRPSSVRIAAREADMQSTVARLSRIAPELPVADLRAALMYYRQRLGFEVAMEMPDGEYAIVERDGVAIHLFRDDRNRSPIGMHIFTPDIDELYREFQSRGALFSQQIERKPWGNREFRIEDEFGNELKFTEPLAED
jgi:uncharacterized glyoxalase superfamily protein PhnB